ncbi:MAG TPA: hypothetical protein VKS20_15400 [Candidatus Acidoferrales bacterium]|nr:hypothetical protein [Candidatus Acidoferrales bacterium]
MPNPAAMPSLNVLISTGQICQSIRSKKLFYESEEDASDARNAGPFWCGRTQSAVGPDGQFVTFDSCRPSRSCCRTT